MGMIAHEIAIPARVFGGEKSSPSGLYHGAGNPGS